MRARTGLSLGLAMALTAATSATADEVVTHDGIVYRGDLLAHDRDAVQLRAGDWTITVPDAQVRLLRHGLAVRYRPADRAEDRAFAARALGAPAEVFTAYAEAIQAVLQGVGDGDLFPEEASALVEVYLTEQERAVRRAQLRAPWHRQLESLLDDGRLTSFVRDLAQEKLAASLWIAGDLTRATELYDGLGVVRSFFVLGPFDNERGTGFDREDPPETEGFQPEATYPGKIAPVRWRPLAVAPPDGIVDLDAYVAPNDQAHAYLVTYVEAERAGPVALRIGSDEAMAVWVNGRAAGRFVGRRPFALDQDHLGVRLRAGWNQILLKVGDQTGAWGVRLRISGLTGGPAGVRGATLEEIGASPELGTVGSEHHAGSVVPARGALGRWGGLDVTGLDWRTAFHVGVLHRAVEAFPRTEHPDREALEHAAARAPGVAEVWVRLSEALSHEAEYSVNREDNPQRQALERALEADPSHVEARVRLASYYANRLGSVDRATRVLQPIVGSCPQHVGVSMLWAELLTARGLDPLAAVWVRDQLAWWEGRVEREEAGHVHPRLLGVAQGTARARGDVEAELGWLDRRLAANARDMEALRRQALLWRDRGQVGLADMLLRMGLRFEPGHMGLRLDLGVLLLQAGRAGEASEVFEGSLGLAPQQAGLWARLAEAQQALGDEGAAREAIERALELEPNDRGLQRYLAYLQRGEAREESFEARWVEDAEALVEAAREIPLDPRLARRVVFRQEVARVLADGRQRAFTQEVVRVENEAGARAMSRYDTVYSSDQRVVFLVARVLRADGREELLPVRTFRAQRGEFVRYLRAGVELPPLEPGDAVEVQYRTEDLEQGFFGDYYGNTAYFQGEAPMEWVRYVLVGPQERAFYVNPSRWEGSGVVLERSREEDAERGLQIVRCEARGVPALEREPGQPWDKELLPQVQVSTFQDWDAFARWYWGLVADQHEAGPELEATARRLVEGAETDLEKVQRIYDFVVTEVRYNAAWEFGVHGFKPYNATRILSRRFGDCKDKSTLINTMLGVVGIESHPVLIFAEDVRGREDLSLPLMNHFNHCISWVDVGEEGIFVDGTAEHHPFGTLPTMDYGASVVVITPEGGVVRDISLRAAAANQIREEHALVVRPGGGARMSSRLEGTGTYEAVLRDLMVTEGRRAQLLEPRIGVGFPGARVVEVRSTDPQDLTRPMEVELEVEVPSVLQPGSDGGLELRAVRSWLFELLYLRGRSLSNLAADPERSHDVVLPVPSGVQEDVRYVLPAELRVERVPEDVVLEAPFGRYELRYTREDGQLRARRTLEIETNRITVEDYPAFREFLGAIERAERERVIVREGGTDQ